MKSRIAHGRGFTLVELLVVVAIIGLLISLMIPALGKAKVRARKVACGGTLHGLSVAMKVYLSENRERYPVAAQMPSVNTSLPALPAVLQNGGNSISATAWRCPADNVNYVRSSDNKAFGSYFEGETLSYEYNMSLGGKPVEQNFLYPNLGVAGIFVLTDFDAFHGNKGDTRAVNILFVDGHVGNIDDIATALH